MSGRSRRRSLDARKPSTGPLPSMPLPSDNEQPLTFEATNSDIGTLIPGTPICMAGGSVWKALATSQGRSCLCGLAATAAQPTLPVTVHALGPLVLTAQQWDAVTGQSGGLTPGAAYYVDSTAGRLTTTPPTAPGSSVVFVGFAVMSTLLNVNPRTPVLL